MVQYNGTPISPSDREFLLRNGGSLVDAHNHSAGVTGYALASGVRFYDTPAGTVLESPKDMGEAQKLISGGPGPLVI